MIIGACWLNKIWDTNSYILSYYVLALWNWFKLVFTLKLSSHVYSNDFSPGLRPDFCMCWKVYPEKKPKFSFRFRFIYAMQPHWNVGLLCECDREHWCETEIQMNLKFGIEIQTNECSQSVHAPVIFSNNLGLSIEFKERFIPYANYVPGICTAARTPIYGQFFHQSRKCVQQHQR